MTALTTMTAEEFDRLSLDESERLELWDGEVIEVASPTPEHGETRAALNWSARSYMLRENLGVTYTELEFDLGGPQRVKPDLAILLGPTLARLDRQRSPARLVPDGVAEIISPSERSYELERKVWLYLNAGVREVFVIHRETQTVYRHSPTDVRRFGHGDIMTSDLLPGWSVPVTDLFALPPGARQ